MTSSLSARMVEVATAPLDDVVIGFTGVTIYNKDQT